MKKERRGKRPLTYLEAHNKAVRLYQKSSIFLLWAGIVNLFSIIIGIIQILASSIIENLPYAWPTSGFSMGLSIQQLVNKLLLENVKGTLIVDFLMIIIALILSAGFALLGFYASRGKKWVLLLGSSLYVADFALMIIVCSLNLVPFNYTNYAFSIATHVVILLACIVAISQYYNVIHIEVVFKGKNALKLDEEVESEVIAHGKE